MLRNKYFIISVLIIIAMIVIYLAGYQEESPVAPSRVEVVLYFSTRDAMYLKGETREVERGNLYKNTLEELIKGPTSSDLGRTIPEGVSVIAISVKDGVAYPDFNQALVEKHWGGSTGEIMTVYSIVNTLAQFPEIERVQLLVEGEKIETLAGHMYLTEPLEPDQELLLKEE